MNGVVAGRDLPALRNLRKNKLLARRQSTACNDVCFIYTFRDYSNYLLQRLFVIFIQQKIDVNESSLLVDADSDYDITFVLWIKRCAAI